MPHYMGLSLQVGCLAASKPLKCPAFGGWLCLCVGVLFESFSGGMFVGVLLIGLGSVGGSFLRQSGLVDGFDPCVELVASDAVDPFDSSVDFDPFVESVALIGFGPFVASVDFDPLVELVASVDFDPFVETAALVDFDPFVETTALVDFDLFVASDGSDQHMERSALDVSV